MVLRVIATCCCRRCMGKSSNAAVRELPHHVSVLGASNLLTSINPPSSSHTLLFDALSDFPDRNLSSVVYPSEKLLLLHVFEIQCLPGTTWSRSLTQCMCTFITTTLPNFPATYLVTCFTTFVETWEMLSRP
jgi:hypothetical protein